MRQISDELRGKLRAAAPIFAERGFDATTIGALRDATGVPSSTLYYNFAGKEEILAFLLEDWLDRTSAAVDAAIASDRTASERLGDLIEAQLAVQPHAPAPDFALRCDEGRVHVAARHLRRLAVLLRHIHQHRPRAVLHTRMAKPAIHPDAPREDLP